MDKTKINKGRMYHSTNLVLDKFSELFSEHPELNQAHQDFKVKISSIDDEQQVQVVDTKGLTLGKVSKRIDLTQTGLKFSRGLRALATVEKDPDLLAKSNYQLSDLNRLPDPILFDVVMMLFKLAIPLQAKLVKFFISEDDFMRIEALLTEFKASIPQKRLATTVSKSSTKKISDVFKSTDKLLKDVIDVYMAPYEYQYPDFFREYTNARIIVGYTGRGKGKNNKDDLNGNDTPAS